MASRIPPGPNDHCFGMRTMSRMKADVLGTYTRLQRQYGDSVSFRTGPFRLYVFYHPDQVQDVLVKHAKSFVRLPRVMKTFSQWNGNSVLIAEGESWIRQRRLVQQAFQPRRMDAYAHAVVSAAQEWVKHWQNEARAQSDDPVLDIDQEMTQLTLAIICRTMFDTSVEEISDDIAKSVAILSEIAFDEMQAPVRVPRWLPTARNRRKRWAIDTLERTVWKFIRERRADGCDHSDLLSMLLTSVDDETGATWLNDTQVRDEVMTLMLAGHDTSAAAFDWLWYNIARHPHVAQRCQEEVDAVVGHRSPTLKDTEHLPYLVATIKETLRMYPPAIGVILRQATRDLTLDGYDVPRGSLVTLSSFVTQRDSRWFAEPLTFNPDRFLGLADGATLPGTYFPFGGGPRVCIGQSFAMMELALVAAVILQQGQFESTTDVATEPPLKVTMALRPGERLKLRWKPRKRTSESIS